MRSEVDRGVITYLDFNMKILVSRLVVILALATKDEAINISVLTNPACVGETVQLKCEFPSLLTRTDDGYFKYISSSPDWKENGNFIKLSDSGYSSSLLSSTEAFLTISSISNADVEVTHNYSCILFLNDGQGRNGGIEESNRAPVTFRTLSQPNVEIKPKERKAMMQLSYPDCSNMLIVTVSDEKNDVVYNGSETSQSNITVYGLEPATTYKAHVVAMNKLRSMETTANFRTLQAPTESDAVPIGVPIGVGSFALVLLFAVIVMCCCICSKTCSTRLKCKKCNKVGKANAKQIRTNAKTNEDKGLAQKEDA